jgi:cytochrome c5
LQPARYNAAFFSKPHQHTTAGKATMSDEHTSFIKTPKQLAIVMVLAFAVPIVLIVLLTQLVTGMMPVGGAEADDKVLERIRPVGNFAFAEVKEAGNKTGEQVYQTVCKTCHEGGLAGAPKFADKAAWAPHIKEGFDALVKNAINGITEGTKVMPPKGGNPDLTDTEIARAVAFMGNAAGASFKEPAASSSATAASSAPAAPIASAAAASMAVAQSATPPSAAAPAAAAPLDLKSAEALMQKSGCAACHSVDKKIVGPAYQDVAAKYRGDKDAMAKLVQKVKTGGSGVWGDVPMPPNGQIVPEADIKALVSWILTLKK